MTRGRFGTVVLGALLMASFGSSVRAGVVVDARAQGTKRVVVMSITVPKKGVPPFTVTTREDEMVTLSIDGVGKIGFEPTFHKNSESPLTVTVFDIATSPRQKLGEVEVPVAGKAVQTKTTPSFGIQITKVTQPK